MEKIESRPIRWAESVNLGSSLAILKNLLLLAILFAMWLASSFLIYTNREMPHIFVDGDADAVFMGIVLGLYLSRWALIALLVILLPGKFIVRLGLAMMLFACEAIFVPLFGQFGSPMSNLLSLPLIFVCLAIPFEVLRVAWDARLDVDWFDSVECERLGIRGLFYRVTAAAVLFGIIRLFDQEIALAMLLFSAVLSAFGFFVILPLTVKFLNSRYRFLWFVVSLFLSTAISFGVTIAATVMFFDSDSWFPIVVAAFTATLVLFYSMALSLLTRLGLELKLGGRERLIV